MGKIRNTEKLHYHLMLLPSMVILAMFTVYPNLGSVIAFKFLDPIAGIWGSEWAGLYHFETLFRLPEFRRITWNTFFISLVKIVLNVSFALGFALMLHEIRSRWFKRTVQTVTYLPYFLSWVILAGIFRDVLSLEGLVNGLLQRLVLSEPIPFLTDPVWFLIVVFATDVWRGFGFNAIIFLAALTSINPHLYEAAEVDGASRWNKLVHITLPSIKPTIVLILILSLQGILNAGFDQIFNLYNPLVYSVADIYDTYIYRMGFQSSQYEFATAVGLFRSAVAFLFIWASYVLAEKYGDMKVF
jgi:putative aldouronate transport system permease protein